MKTRKKEECKISVKWIGDPLRRKARVRRQENMTFFTAFKYGNIRGKIGDFVLISNIDASDPDTVDGCDIAKILDLYESADNEEPYRATVQWYSRPKQLPKKFLSHGMPFPEFDHACEIVEDRRNFDNDVSIESFFSECEVIIAMPDEDPKEIISSLDSINRPVFITRFQFWASRGKTELLPISLEDDLIMAKDNDKRRKDGNPDIYSNSSLRHEGITKGRDDRDESPEVSSGEPAVRFVLLSKERKSEKKIESGKSQSTFPDKTKKKLSSSDLSMSMNLGCKPIATTVNECSPSKNKLKKSKRSSSSGLKSAEKETDMMRESFIRLKDKDITEILDEEVEEEKSLSDISSSSSEDEKEGKDGTPSKHLDSSVYQAHVKIQRLKISAENLSTPPKRAEKRRGNTDDGISETQSLSSPKRGRTPRTPSNRERSMASPSIVKSLSAKKRMQLLLESGHNGMALMGRGEFAGPVEIPSSPLEEARARLHVSSVPSSLPCRENEFSTIYSFVEDKILDGAGGCMYICGVPGTGKTATVREVVRQLKNASSKGDIPNFEFAEVNGMKVTEPRRAYSEVLRVLTGKVCGGTEEARELLEQRFSKPAPRRLPTLLLIDELDLLWTKRQDVVYNLMDWPNRDRSRLIVITIANTMDLPERILMGRVSSRLGLTRLTFHPYTFQQLQEIVMSRMKGLKAFDPDAVQLVARKVAAVSGDARRALDICRRATEVAESEVKVDTKHRAHTPKKQSKKTQHVVVTMKHVDEAVSEMISSSKSKVIRSCSRLEKLFLQAVASEVERTGVDEASFERVHNVLGTLCAYSGFRRPTISESTNICWRLGSLRLILTESNSRADVLQRVMLNVDLDSMHYALKVTS